MKVSRPAVVWDGDEALLVATALIGTSLRVVIDAERCKGCGLCIAVCPPAVLGTGPLNTKGYATAVLLDNERCTSCTACALICPESAITVFKPRRPAARSPASRQETRA